MTAALAPTRVSVGCDLLQISATEGNNREDTDHRENNTDPPMPHICCQHENQRSPLVAIPTSVVGNIDVETLEKASSQVVGNRFFLGAGPDVDHERVFEVGPLLTITAVLEMIGHRIAHVLVEKFVEIRIQLVEGLVAVGHHDPLGTLSIGSVIARGTVSTGKDSRNGIDQTSLGGKGYEGLLQSLASPMNSGHHGPDRNVEDVGNLLVGELLDVGEEYREQEGLG